MGKGEWWQGTLPFSGLLAAGRLLSLACIPSYSLTNRLVSPRGIASARAPPAGPCQGFSIPVPKLWSRCAQFGDERERERERGRSQGPERSARAVGAAGARDSLDTTSSPSELIWWAFKWLAFLAAIAAVVLTFIHFSVNI